MSATIERDRLRRHINRQGWVVESVEDWLILSNHGSADAFSVTFSLLGPDGETAEFPRVSTMGHPIATLRVGERKEISAAVPASDRCATDIELCWTEKDGVQRTVVQALQV